MCQKNRYSYWNFLLPCLGKSDAFSDYMILNHARYDCFHAPPPDVAFPLEARIFVTCCCRCKKSRHRWYLGCTPGGVRGGHSGDSSQASCSCLKVQDRDMYFIFIYFYIYMYKDYIKMSNPWLWHLRLYSNMKIMNKLSLTLPLIIFLYVARIGFYHDLDCPACLQLQWLQSCLIRPC